MSRSGHVQTANKAQINQLTSQSSQSNKQTTTRRRLKRQQPQAKSKHYRENESWTWRESEREVVGGEQHVWAIILIMFIICTTVNTLY